MWNPIIMIFISNRTLNSLRLMNNRHLMFAGVVILSCIVSCQKSKPTGKGSDAEVIRVRLADNAGTRADVAEDCYEEAGRELLFSVPFVTEEGDTLKVDAWISDMDETVYSGMQDSSVEPATRGMIRKTDNMKSDKNYFFTTVYDASGSVYNDVIGGASMGNVTVQYVGEQQTWQLGTGYGDTFGEYCYYHWPSDGSDLIFCSKYGEGASNVNWNIGEEKLTFSYVSPVSSDRLHDAAAQSDLLFAMNRQNLNTRPKTDGRSYADIHFDHALTAVRFTRGNLANGTVQNISLKGFRGAGNATANYTQGAKVINDKLDFTWTATGDPLDFTQVFNRVLTDDDPHQDPNSHEVTGASLDPTSNQEYTFFMVPQLLPEGASIEIYIKERIHPIVIDLTGAKDGSGNDMDSNIRDWSGYAGKIITISVNTVVQGGLVDIELSDTVTANVKENVTIHNTAASKDSYVRVAIIANWVNEVGTVIYPYPIDNIFADSHFNFTGVNTGDWTFQNGFYYYEKKLLVNQTVKLINSFTSPVRGDSDFPNDNTAVDHLQMTILVQAVDCDRKADLVDPSKYGWPNVFTE